MGAPKMRAPVNTAPMYDQATANAMAETAAANARAEERLAQAKAAAEESNKRSAEILAVAPPMQESPTAKDARKRSADMAAGFSAGGTILTGSRGLTDSANTSAKSLLGS